MHFSYFRDFLQVIFNKTILFALVFFLLLFVNYPPVKRDIADVSSERFHKIIYYILIVVAILLVLNIFNS